MGHGTPNCEPAKIPRTVHFGKYEHFPVDEIRDDPKYIRWLLKNDMVRLGIALAQKPWIKEFINGE